MPERYERVRVGWHCAKIKGHAELKIEKAEIDEIASFGDSLEVEIVLTRHLQRHARPRSTILNSSFQSFACYKAGSKVKE